MNNSYFICLFIILIYILLFTSSRNGLLLYIYNIRASVLKSQTPSIHIIEIIKRVIINISKNHQNFVLLDDILQKLKKDLQIISTNYNNDI